MAHALFSFLTQNPHTSPQRQLGIIEASYPESQVWLVASRMPKNIGQFRDMDEIAKRSLCEERRFDVPATFRAMRLLQVGSHAPRITFVARLLEKTLGLLATNSQDYPLSNNPWKCTEGFPKRMVIFHNPSVSLHDCWREGSGGGFGQPF